MAKLRRPEYGIYVTAAAPEDIVYAGRRKGVDPPGRVWHAVTAPAERELLEGDLEQLAYRGGAVVRRTRAELDALALALLEGTDDRWLDDLKVRAFLEVLLEEVNILRAAASLPPRTPAQARAAIKTRIAELRTAAAASRRR